MNKLSKSRAYKKAWIEKNKQRISEYNREYRERNKEHIAERRKAWAEENREHIRASEKKYREKNRAKINERRRAYRLRDHIIANFQRDNDRQPSAEELAKLIDISISVAYKNQNVELVRLLECLQKSKYRPI